MQSFRRLTLSRAGGRFQISGLQFQKIYVIEGFHRDYTGGEAAAQTAAPGQSAPFVKLVLRSGVTAFGHVVDGDGKPLPGVRVMLISGRSKRFWATTDAAGRFEVKAVDTGGLTLRARTPGFSPLSRPIEIPPGTPRVDLGAIELPASAVVEGEVTDNRGTPIAGASVESSFSSSDPLQRVEDPASPPLEVKTGPEGRFRLTDLPRDTPFRLQIEHEGYIPLRVPGVKAPLQAPLHLEMRTARGLTGRVVGPEGEPVGGATLSRVEESNEGVSARGEIKLGITDARGGFQISGFEPGPNDLRVQAEGYATKTVRGVMIPADRDLEGLEIVLGRGVILEDGAFVFRHLPEGAYRLRAVLQGFKLSGELREVAIAGRDVQGLDLQLEPEAGATVTGHLLGLRPEEVVGASVVGSGSEAGFRQEVTVEPDGHYEIKNVQRGNWLFNAITPGMRSVQQEIMIQPGESRVVLDFKFGNQGTLAGLVVSAGTGEPVADARVSIDGQGIDGFTYFTPTLRSGEKGAFESRLAPGKYRIKVEKEGYAPAETTAEVRAGGARDVVEIRLKPVGAP
jgi:hypothetical protein